MDRCGCGGWNGLTTRRPGRIQKGSRARVRPDRREGPRPSLSDTVVSLRRPEIRVSPHGRTRVQQSSRGSAVFRPRAGGARGASARGPDPAGGRRSSPGSDRHVSPMGPWDVPAAVAAASAASRRRPGSLSGDAVSDGCRSTRRGRDADAGELPADRPRSRRARCGRDLRPRGGLLCPPSRRDRRARRAVRWVRRSAVDPGCRGADDVRRRRAARAPPRCPRRR